MQTHKHTIDNLRTTLTPCEWKAKLFPQPIIMDTPSAIHMNFDKQVYIYTDRTSNIMLLCAIVCRLLGTGTPGLGARVRHPKNALLLDAHHYSNHTIESNYDQNDNASSQCVRNHKNTVQNRAAAGWSDMKRPEGETHHTNLSANHLCSPVVCVD